MRGIISRLISAVTSVLRLPLRLLSGSRRTHATTHTTRTHRL